MSPSGWGDGSAREQAASCQRVLGGLANIAQQYATKRYRSNVINWGMIPFQYDNLSALNLCPGDHIVIKGILNRISNCEAEIPATVIYQTGQEKDITLTLPNMTEDEAQRLFYPAV